MTTPILDNIETTMSTLIAGMTTTGGYNFNWSIVNEEDDAIGNFPRAIINPRDSLADKEQNMDTVAGIGSRDYTNEVLFTVLVAGEMAAFGVNSNFTFRSVLRKAQDDLKRLFGINNQLGGYCDNILYAASQIEPIKKNDVMSPLQLRTVFKIIYSQDRQTPTQYASS
jgi:hypothetical protein